MDKYVRIKKIGEGSFGKAILMRRKEDGKLCVIKEVSISKMSAKEREDSKKEVQVLSQLHHANIVTYLESFLGKGNLHEKGNLYIVMDYCDGGDLHQYIANQRSVHIEESKVLDIYTQCCLAIKYIHDRKILHRDIKSQNIFLTKTNVVKLGDFGIARVLKSTMELAHTCIGTPYYLSPEIVENRPYNNKSDIWSLGCVLYEMLTLKHAFDAKNIKNLVMKIVRGSYPPVSNRYSFELRALVAQSFKRSPSERPSINSILKKPVIQKIIPKFLSAEESEAQLGDLGMPKRKQPTPSAQPPVAAVEVSRKPLAVKRSIEIASVYGASLAKKPLPMKKPPGAVNIGMKAKKKVIQRPKSSNENSREIAARERRRRNIPDEEQKYLERMNKVQKERWQKQNLAKMKMDRGGGWKNVLGITEEGDKNAGGKDCKGEEIKPARKDEKPESNIPVEQKVAQHKAFDDIFDKPSNPPNLNINAPQKAKVNAWEAPPKGRLNAWEAPPKVKVNVSEASPKGNANRWEAPPKAKDNRWEPPPKAKVNPWEAPAKANINVVQGNARNDRAKLLDDYWQRKKEAEENKKKAHANVFGKVNWIPPKGNDQQGMVPARKNMEMPGDVGARKRAERDYLRQLEAIRYQNYVERKAINLRGAKEPPGNVAKPSVQGDPKYDPVARKKKIDALKKEGEEASRRSAMLHQQARFHDKQNMERKGRAQRVVNAYVENIPDDRPHIQEKPAIKNIQLPKEKICVPPVGIETMLKKVNEQKLVRSYSEGDLQEALKQAEKPFRKHWGVPNVKSIGLANLTMEITASAMEATAPDDIVENEENCPADQGNEKPRKLWANDGNTQFIANLANKDISYTQTIHNEIPTDTYTKKDNNASSDSTIVIAKKEEVKKESMKPAPVSFVIPLEDDNNVDSISSRSDTYVISSPGKHTSENTALAKLTCADKTNVITANASSPTSNHLTCSETITISPPKRHSDPVISNVAKENSIPCKGLNDLHDNSHSNIISISTMQSVMHNKLIQDLTYSDADNTSKDVVVNNVGVSDSNAPSSPKVSENEKNSGEDSVLKSELKLCDPNECSVISREHLSEVGDDKNSIAEDIECEIVSDCRSVSSEPESSEKGSISNVNAEGQEYAIIESENIPSQTKQAWTEGGSSEVASSAGNIAETEGNALSISSVENSLSDDEDLFHTASRVLGLQTGSYDTELKRLRTCSLPDLRITSPVLLSIIDEETDEDNQERLSSSCGNDTSSSIEKETTIRPSAEESVKENEDTEIEMLEIVEHESENDVEDDDADIIYQEEAEEYESMLESMRGVLTSSDEGRELRGSSINEDDHVECEGREYRGSSINEDDHVEWESDEENEEAANTVKQKDKKLNDGKFSRIEASRKELEDELGIDLLLNVYRRLQAIQEDENDEADLGTEEINNILGDKGHLYQKILYLVIADAAYCEGNDGSEE